MRNKTFHNKISCFSYMYKFDQIVTIQRNMQYIARGTKINVIYFLSFLKLFFNIKESNFGIGFIVQSINMNHTLKRKKSKHYNKCK